MMDEDRQVKNESESIPASTIEVPASTPWPMVAALGLSLLFAGLVTSAVISLLGVAMVLAGAVGWFGEVLPRENREMMELEAAAPAMVAARVGVAHLKVGEEGHRAVLPLEIYPYSAGIKGGIAGGFVMAGLAMLQGIVLHGSPWYTVNILAATVLPRMSHADTATLSAFNPVTIAVATMIHGVVSILVGLLYGVLLPMLPRSPIIMGGVVAPCLWTGLLWATLDVINPVLDARIEWRWFILCQIGFGLTAGIVVARSERIKTRRDLPFAVMAGIEAPGLRQPEDR